MPNDRSTELTGKDRTADGVLITQGLRVWTNNMDKGRIDLSDAEYEAGVLWFRVVLDKDDSSEPRGTLQSSDRVATVNPFTNERA